MAHEDNGDQTVSKPIADQQPGVDDTYLIAEVDALRGQLHTLYADFLTAPSTEAERVVMAENVVARGKAVGERLDQLSPEERGSYVTHYCIETGFPDTRETSRRALERTVYAVQETARRLDLTLAWVGYAPTCSVGQGEALPGADLDFLTTVTRDEDPRVGDFDRHLPHKLDPRIVSIEMETEVLSLKEWLELARHLVDHPPGAEEYYRVPGWPSDKLHRARLALAHFQAPGGDLVQNLWPDEIATLAQAAGPEREEDAQLAQAWHQDEKHSVRRQVVNTFKTLTVDEQFVLVRILQISSEAIALDATNTGPHVATLQSLQAKGLLVEKNGSLNPVWAPFASLTSGGYFDFYPDESNT